MIYGDLRAGQILIADREYWEDMPGNCIEPGQQYMVQEDRGRGVFNILCEAGFHGLGGQVDGDGELIGFTLLLDAPVAAPAAP